MILLAIVVGFGYHTAAFALLVLIMAGLVAVKTLAKREEGSGPELFALLMLGVALALGIGVEFLKVNLVDPGRMNTVFKFYFHAWTLMALASAFFAWRLGAMAILRQFTVRRAAWTGALVILIAAGLVYPIAATPDRSKHRFEDSPITIDGMAYMPTAVYYDDADRSGSIEPPEVLELGWDYHAIVWLQDNIEGSACDAGGELGAVHVGEPGVGVHGAADSRGMGLAPAAATLGRSGPGVSPPRPTSIPSTPPPTSRMPDASSKSTACVTSM